MQKHTISLLLILFISFFRVFGQVDEPTFRYKLLETDDPTNKSVVQFYANAPSGSTGYSWSFGQGGITSTDQDPSFEYDISGGSEFIVTLNYSGLTAPIERTIQVNPAFFHVLEDSQLENIATLKRIFRSAFMIEQNNPAAIGNMRFNWTFTGFTPTNYSFSDDALGDYPNVYHTFENGGDYSITLEVYHVSSPANLTTFTRNISLSTVIGADLIDFDNVPNVFTPNADGVNDFFEVISSGTSRLRFKVLTRSGAVIYEKEANVIKWDGKNYYGNDLPDGIYYYIIEDISETKVYNTAKGFFYIYR